MASENLTQLRRLVFRYKANATNDWTVFEIGPENLGQDTVVSYSATPRMAERASAMGTSSTPIPGTVDEFTASITILADTAAMIGKVLRNWKPATYTNASASAGQMLFGGTSDDDVCAGAQYVDVIAQGICDDGSTSDIEFTRCFPQIDGDLEIGTSETTEVTFALNPQFYNKETHASDGYPQYGGRLGDYDLTTKMRLNATTGEYTPVSGASE